jgi:hypothetical protein
METQAAPDNLTEAVEEVKEAVDFAMTSVHCTAEERERLKSAIKAYGQIADDLYAAIAGPNGLNCAGGCRVDGPCVCSPAFRAIAALRLA